MRVLVAPDAFAGTLTAPQAAAAIAEGWRRTAPEDELDCAPMSDGGPGFVDVLHATLGGELVATTVPGPLGGEVPATVLLHDATAYVEAAQACGLHLVAPEARDPERATSAGVGALLRAAVGAGARTVVVGLGGTGTNDGGAGLLAALGATTSGGVLDAGPGGLAMVSSVDLRPAREAVAGVRLVAATDVDNPLLGLLGATKTYGPQKGLPEDRLVAVDAALERLATATDRALARAPGAGAAGGLGFALLLLGAQRRAGIGLVSDAVRLEERARQADLVVTGEGALDFTSGSGKVPAGVAAAAMAQARPCVVLAGRVLIGGREMRAMGVESGYAVVDLVGEAAALADPAGSLARLAERVARSWSVS